MECALNGFLSPAQRERLLSAVTKRRSIRVFSPLEDVALKSALHFTAARLSLPGVRIVIGEGDPEKLFHHLPVVGGVTGTGLYAAVIADEGEPLSHLHAGICGEAFVLEAVSLGLGACWLGFFKENGLYIPMEEYEKVMAIIAVGIPQGEPRALKRKTLTEICYGDSAAWPLWAYNAAESLRLAPSAINRQPWRLAFAGHTLALFARPFASDLELGIALLHLSLGLGETAHEVRWGEGKEVAMIVAEDKA